MVRRIQIVVSLVLCGGRWTHRRRYVQFLPVGRLLHVTAVMHALCWGAPCSLFDRAKTHLPLLT